MTIISSRLPRIVCRAFILLILWLPNAQAQLTWDADTNTTGPQDGSGQWNTLTANTNWWNDSLSGNVSWVDGPNTAVFGAGTGPAGTVTVSSNTTNTVGSIIFNPPGSGSYIIDGGSSTTSKLNLSSNPMIYVTNGVPASINVVLSGAAFVKDGAGTLTLNPPAPNIHAGTTRVVGGTLVVGTASSNRRLIPGDLIVTNGSVVRLGATENITNAATVYLYPGTTFDTGGKGQTLAGLLLDNATITNGSTETLTINGTIDARSGIAYSAAGKIDAITFIKSSPGTVTLQTKGSTAAAGGLTNTILNEGTLVFDYAQNSSKLNDSVGSLIVNGGTLIFTNGTHTETLTSVTLTNGVITNASGTARLSLPSGSYDVRNGAAYIVLSGAASLTKSTPGTVILAATNTYSGGTFIGAGVLQLGDGSVNGSVSGAITDDALLVADPGNAVTISSVISGTGALSKIGAGTLLLTQINSYQGATTISNGVLSIDSDATPGDGNGTLNLSGGTLNATASRSPTTAPVANPINVTADSVITTTSTSTSSDVDLNLSNDSIGGAAGTLTFSNANGLAASVFAPRFSGSFNFNRPVVIANGGAIGSTRLNSFNSTGTTQTFNGVISGSGGYRRTASTIGTGGVTVFTADNAYTGLTEVNRGTLLVNGSLAAESPVTVGGTSQNGILGGTGTIYGPVTVLNSGTLAPGTSIGQLTISNTLTLQSGSTTVIELNKTLGTNDFVRGLSNVAYAGTLVVTNLSGTLASSNTFKLFEAGAYTGAFDLFDLPPLANGLTWDTTGLTSDGTIKVIGTAIAQPHIDSVSLSSGSLVLSGTGGTAGADYHVLASTNVALPLAQWSPIQTNQFTVGGNFAFTNSIDSNTPKLFFILQVP